MRTRAERRHHHKRMLEKVKNFSIYQYFFWNEDDKLRHQRKVAETRKPCSCHMCRNPRHSGFHKGKEKKTMQERKFDERALQDLQDSGD